MNPLPAIIISGFLGAGKTTLLNHLLAQGLSGKRVGVIVNDFGKLNVDARLVQSGGHPLLELSNGCVCCSLQLGLAQAVLALAGRGHLDLVVIEASGISVSSALLHVVESPELADRIVVRSVIAVVDARRYARVLHSLPVIRDQIAHANLTVLNHCDEVDAATIDASKDLLRQQNPAAPVRVTRHGQVDADDLLADASRRPAVAEPARHNESWRSYEVVLTDAYDADQLVTVVDQLPDTVERVKGIVSRGDELRVLQRVGTFPASLERLRGARRDEACDRLVIIARQPIDAQLEAIFGGRAVVAATNSAT